VGFIIYHTCPILLFIRKEEDGTVIILIFYVDDYLYVSTLDTAKEKSCRRNLLPDSMWSFVAARINQDKDSSAYIHQSTYAKSMVFRFLEGAGIKISTCCMEGLFTPTLFFLPKI
jgi:hypothetical protein